MSGKIVLVDAPFKEGEPRRLMNLDEKCIQRNPDELKVSQDKISSIILSSMEMDIKIRLFRVLRAYHTNDEGWKRSYKEYRSSTVSDCIDYPPSGLCRAIRDETVDHYATYVGNVFNRYFPQNTPLFDSFKLVLDFN